MQNLAGGSITVERVVSGSGIEITGNGWISNDGTIELNETVNIPLHISGGNMAAITVS